MPGKSTTSIHKNKYLSGAKRRNEPIRHAFLPAELIKRLLREYGLSRSNPDLRRALTLFAEARAKEILGKATIIVSGKRQRKLTSAAVELAYEFDRDAQKTVAARGGTV